MNQTQNNPTHNSMELCVGYFDQVSRPSAFAWVSPNYISPTGSQSSQDNSPTGSQAVKITVPPDPKAVKITVPPDPKPSM